MSPHSPHEKPAFGKRGRVELSPPATTSMAAPASGIASILKWIGGGLVALVLLGLVTGGTGGTGLLGGILGGLLGHHLANRGATTTPATAAAQTPGKAAAASTTVQRGGFGATGTSSGFFSGG